MIDLSNDAGLRRAFDDLAGWSGPIAAPSLDQLEPVRLITTATSSSRARVLAAIAVVMLLVVAGAVLVTRDASPPVVPAASGEWVGMAESPLAPRRYPTALWTGEAVIIWGGVGATAFADGARYWPSTDSWAPMAPAPEGVVGGRALAVWTGHEAVYVTSAVDPETGGSGWDYDVIAYDPKANRWDTWTQARFEQDPATDVLIPRDLAVPMDGPEALAAGPDEQLWLFGWRSALNHYAWVETSLDHVPLLGTADWYGRDKVVQESGDQVYVGLSGPVGTTTWGWGYVLDMSTGAVSRVDAPPVGDAVGIEVLRAAVDGDVVLVGVATDGSGQSQRAAWRLDLATRRWTTVEPPPDGPTAAGEPGVSLVSTPLGPIMLGGLDEGGGTSGGLTSAGAVRQAADNELQHWATLPEPPIDLHRVDAAAVWTGTEVIVWGGATTATGTPSGELADGARYRLP